MHEDAAAYDDLLARGFRAVPVTIVSEPDGAVRAAIKGFDEAALRAALEGRPAGGASPSRDR